MINPIYKNKMLKLMVNRLASRIVSN